MKNLSVFILFTILATFLAAILTNNYSFNSSGISTSALPTFGRVDFLAYWSAAQVFFTGGNPYDRDVMLSLQEVSGSYYGSVQPFLNPPWALITLLPIFNTTFTLGVYIWFSISSLLFALSGVLVWRAKSGARNFEPYIIALSLTFYPCIETFFWGQFGSFISFACAGFYWGYKRNNSFLMGFSLSLLSIKPTIIYLFLIVAGYWIVSERKWKVFFSGAFSFFLFFLIVVYLRNEILLEWWDAVDASSSLKFSRSSASVFGILRLLIYDGVSIPPKWPVLIAPFVGLIVTFIYYLKKDFKINWDRDLPFILILNFIFCPFVWTHDFSPLLIVQVFILSSKESHSRKINCFFLLLFIQVLCLLLIYIFKSPVIEYFWFPFLILYMWKFIGTSDSLVSTEVLSYEVKK